jgi:hypothetical protein
MPIACVWIRLRCTGTPAANPESYELPASDLRLVLDVVRELQAIDWYLELDPARALATGALEWRLTKRYASMSLALMDLIATGRVAQALQSRSLEVQLSDGRRQQDGTPLALRPAADGADLLVDDPEYGEEVSIRLPHGAVLRTNAGAVDEPLIGARYLRVVTLDGTHVPGAFLATDELRMPRRDSVAIMRRFIAAAAGFDESPLREPSQDGQRER